MRRIFTIGETVMDIVFKDNIPIAAKAGGSMLNASVSLGRLKQNVHFISEFATDHVGEIINSFLNENGIDTSYIYRYSEGKSSIALAFLDNHEKADYSFYKFYPESRLDIQIPEIEKNDIVMFGSYFGIAPEIRSTLLKILHKAKEKEAIIIYDPNFRKAHIHQLKELLPFILENFSLADIIKGSDEDFLNIFNANTMHDAFASLNDSSKILIYTSGKDGAGICTRNFNFQLPSKKIKPVSTIGAGDNFTAGISYSIVENNFEHSALLNVSKLEWSKILETGIDFALEVCLNIDNYISENFAKEYISKNALKQ